MTYLHSVSSKPPKVTHIGRRHTTKHVVRYDSETGAFEEVNCKISDNDLTLQQLLLTKRTRRPTSWLTMLGWVVVGFTASVLVFNFLRA